MHYQQQTCPCPCRSHRTWQYLGSFNFPFILPFPNCNYCNSNTTILPNIKHRILSLNTVLNTAHTQWELGLEIWCPPETQQPCTLSPTPSQSAKPLTQGFIQKHASTAFQDRTSLQPCLLFSPHCWAELSYPSTFPVPKGKHPCAADWKTASLKDKAWGLPCRHPPLFSKLTLFLSLLAGA